MHADDVKSFYSRDWQFWKLLRTWWLPYTVVKQHMIDRQKKSGSSKDWYFCTSFRQIFYKRYLRPGCDPFLYIHLYVSVLPELFCFRTVRNSEKSSSTDAWRWNRLRRFSPKLLNLPLKQRHGRMIYLYSYTRTSDRILYFFCLYISSITTNDGSQLFLVSKRRNADGIQQTVSVKPIDIVTTKTGKPQNSHKSVREARV